MAEQPPDGAGAGKPLTTRQEQVALLLASGRSMAEAAKQTGTGERTVKLWAATVPAFTAAVRRLRGELTAQAVGRLVSAMTQAADTLVGLLAATSETVRCSAARAILEGALKLREQTELEERLEALENRLSEGKRRC